jgi:hypothetical protein
MKALIVLGRFALAGLWIFTGITSLLFAPDVGYEILQKAGITGNLAAGLIIAGSATDIFLGIWLLSSKRIQICCLFQIIVIIFYTIILTVISPDLWIHPFGPLTKNIPMLVLILIVSRVPPSVCK